MTGGDTRVPPASASTVSGGKTTAEVEAAPAGGTTTFRVTGVAGMVAARGVEEAGLEESSCVSVNMKGPSFFFKKSMDTARR
jgi:hypothetical protein